MCNSYCIRVQSERRHTEPQPRPHRKRSRVRRALGGLLSQAGRLPSAGLTQRRRLVPVLLRALVRGRRRGTRATATASTHRCWQCARRPRGRYGPRYKYTSRGHHNDHRLQRTGALTTRELKRRLYDIKNPNSLNALDHHGSVLIFCTPGAKAKREESK